MTESAEVTDDVDMTYHYSETSSGEPRYVVIVTSSAAVEPPAWASGGDMRAVKTSSADTPMAAVTSVLGRLARQYDVPVAELLRHDRVDVYPVGDGLHLAGVRTEPADD